MVFNYRGQGVQRTTIVRIKNVKTQNSTKSTNATLINNFNLTSNEPTRVRQNRLHSKSRQRNAVRAPSISTNRITRVSSNKIFQKNNFHQSLVTELVSPNHQHILLILGMSSTSQ